MFNQRPARATSTHLRLHEQVLQINVAACCPVAAELDVMNHTDQLAFSLGHRQALHVKGFESLIVAFVGG